MTRGMRVFIRFLDPSALINSFDRISREIQRIFPGAKVYTKTTTIGRPVLVVELPHEDERIATDVCSHIRDMIRSAVRCRKRVVR